jgi:hypothetical protein
MMRNREDTQSIRQNLHRWRGMLREDIGPDAKNAARELIDGAEKRLAEIEGRATPATTQAP